jgi:hypothetical protein
METVCNIEIIKDGVYFIARAHLNDGKIREYRHHILEDMLTEMAIDLEDVLSK